MVVHTVPSAQQGSQVKIVLHVCSDILERIVRETWLTQVTPVVLLMEPIIPAVAMVIIIRIVQELETALCVMIMTTCFLTTRTLHGPRQMNVEEWRVVQSYVRTTRSL